MQQPVLDGKSGKTPTGFIQRFRLLMMTQSINQSSHEKLQSELEPKLISKFTKLICSCAVSSAESDMLSGAVRKDAYLGLFGKVCLLSTITWLFHCSSCRSRVSEEHNGIRGTRTRADAGRETSTGEVKVARAPDEANPFLRDAEMANDVEEATQARSVERDRNELPWKDHLVIYTSVK